MKIDVCGETVKYSDGLLSVYNSKGFVIHQVDSSGMKYWWEYDKNGNIIHYKLANGYEYWKEYDDNNNKIHFKKSNGYERWYVYGVNNNMVHDWDSEQVESWFDSKGNQITKQEFDGLYKTETKYVLRNSEAEETCTGQSSYTQPQPVVEPTCYYNKQDVLGNIFYIKNRKGETWSKFCGTTLVHSLHSWGEENWYAPNGKIIFKEEFDKIYDTQYVLRNQ